MSNNTRPAGENEEVAHDERFKTRDTQLAAALLTLDFDLAPQPFTTIIDPLRPGAQVTTIFFLPTNKSGVHATRIKHRFDLAYHDQMPMLAWMKEGFIQRRFLVKEVIHGNNFPTPGSSPLKAWHCTDSLRMAAVLRACKIQFIGYRDQKFYFDKQGELCEAKAKREGANTRERWTHAGLEQQQILIDVIKGPQGKIGRQAVASGPFGTAFMNAKMTEEQRRAFLFEIHNRR